MTEASIASSPRHRWWSGVEILGWLASQGTRLVLWLPVMLGAGIAVYFALPIEPHWWLGPLGLGLGVLALVVLRNAGLVMRAAIYGGAALALGFTAAQWQTETVAAPQLDRSTGPTTVTGRVVSRDVSSAGTRVVLDTPTIENLAFEETPERVRVRLTTRSVTPDIGAHIALTAVLNPPGSPVLPGGFDFRRYAFFQRLGAVGYAISRPTVTAEAEAGGLSLQLERLRHGIAGRVDDAVAKGLVSDRAGSVAIVLLTGDRSAISDNLYSDMRRSGLAHLLAISGLHVG
ncbi:MAG: ComEC/Rec2 family competence protein, partial [Pseudomonadota bacterium]